MPDKRWARLQTDADVPLRRGAWYRVLSLTSESALLGISRGFVRVSPALLEFRAQIPPFWSVVRQPEPVPQLPAAHRAGYAVCPGCSHRVPLPQIPMQQLRCPKCHESAEIAWDDAYLERKDT